MRRRRSRNLFGIVLTVIVVVVSVYVATLPEEPSRDYRCDDSDGGDDPFAYGSTADWRSGLSITDKCLDSDTLQEFSCEHTLQDPRGHVVVSRWQCECGFGRCIAPDLVIDDIVISREPSVNDEFKVSFNIRNTGDASVEAIDFVSYFEPGYAVLIEPPLTPLAPGATTDITYSVTYQLPGTFRIVSVVDPHDIVQERDETNNERTDTITVRSR